MPLVCFFFSDSATTEIYTLSLHDALPSWPPICSSRPVRARIRRCWFARRTTRTCRRWQDRKSTRLNSSHMSISYAVFCLEIKRPQDSLRRTHPDTNYHHPAYVRLPHAEPL